jgi:hypothetical protein
MVDFTVMIINTNHSPLGDCVCILLNLENYCINNGIKAKIRGPKVYEELLQLFHFNHVSLTKENGFNIDHLYCNTMRESYLTDGECFPWPWIISMKLAQKFGGTWGETYNHPVYLGKVNPPENITLVQFDSRSARHWRSEPELYFKKPFTKPEINLIIKKHAKTPVAAIGGNDTVPYLDIEHRRGNLHYICKQLSGCKTFLGCDSGISHLASIMNVDTKLIPISRHGCTKIFYSIYDNVKCHKRELISYL